MPPSIRPLSEALAIKAAAELNEVPERIQSDLDAIREWLKKTPHLRARQDDQFLVGFLRGCKYRLEKVKEKLDMYYSVRSSLPEIITNRDPMNPRIREIIRLGVVIPLPETIEPDGPRIVLIRPGAYNAKTTKFENIIELGTMIQDILNIEDDNFVVGGLVAILDFAQVSATHLTQLKPMLLKKIFTLLQDASPIRQRGFHFINLPPTFQTVYNMANGLLSVKNQKRMEEKFKVECHIHGNNMQALFKHIPQNIMPTEYGGQAGAIQLLAMDWEQRLMARQPYFEEDKLYGVDKEKKIGSSKSSKGSYGSLGSFTKLEID